MLYFEKIRYKNILSFGNMWTEIQLDKSPTTLIVGKNGAGKSAIIEVIVFGLFGKPFRKTKKIQKLINFKNDKDLVVEIFFRANNDYYMVRRGLKPSIFEIYKNGYETANLINQESSSLDYQQLLEKTILHYNYDSFNQIVILGKAKYISFMSLEKKDKRDFIESMLKIDIFSKMNEIHRSKVAALKEQMFTTKNEISLLKDKIAIQDRYIKKLKNDDKQQKEDYILNLKNQIKDIKKECAELKKTLDLENEKLIEVDTKKLSELSKKLEKLNSIKVKSDIKQKSMNDIVVFFNTNNVCPTCTQSISDNHKQDKLNEYNIKNGILNDAKNKVITQIELIIDEIETIQQNIKSNNVIDNNTRVIKTKLNEKLSLIKKLNASIENPIIIDNAKVHETELNKLMDLQAELDKLLELNSTQLEKFIYFDAISVMLKDSGIKQTIIRRYIPIINNLISSYLNKMGFHVRFELDEDFSESIWARGNESLGYNSFSEGEKQRIDLALLFSWRDIARLQNDMNTNLLFFDEVLDGSLEQSGVDSVIELFETFDGLNIFVITHSEEKWADKFRSTISVYRENGFSMI